LTSNDALRHVPLGWCAGVSHAMHEGHIRMNVVSRWPERGTKGAIAGMLARKTTGPICEGCPGLTPVGGSRWAHDCRLAMARTMDEGRFRLDVGSEDHSTDLRRTPRFDASWGLVMKRRSSDLRRTLPLDASWGSPPLFPSSHERRPFLPERPSRSSNPASRCANHGRRTRQGCRRFQDCAGR